MLHALRTWSACMHQTFLTHIFHNFKPVIANKLCYRLVPLQQPSTDWSTGSAIIVFHR